MGVAQLRERSRELERRPADGESGVQLGWFRKKREPRRRRRRVVPPNAGQKKSGAATPGTPEDVARFDVEVRETVDRYAQSQVPMFQITNERGRTAFHEVWPKLYADWLEIRTPWDRRSMIYSALDSFFEGELPTWKLAERLLDDRRAEHAIQILDIENGPPAEDPHQWWATLAKCHMVLSRYGDAIEAAAKGVALEPGHERARTQYADALHLTQRTEEAHEIYDELVAAHAEASGKGVWNPSFEDAIGFHEGGIHSPVFALALLEGESPPSGQAWEFAANEFPGSPQFRCRHAYHLVAGEVPLKGLVKILVLTQEMPWFREAALNTLSMLEHFDPGGDRGLFAEDRLELARRVEENGWTADDLHQEDIHFHDS